MVTTQQEVRLTTDLDVEYRVWLYLHQRQLLTGVEVEIRVEGGVVTLGGKVPSFHRRQVLGSLTRKVAGVVQVVDELVVCMSQEQGAVTLN